MSTWHMEEWRQKCTEVSVMRPGTISTRHITEDCVCVQFEQKGPSCREGMISDLPCQEAKYTCTPQITKYKHTNSFHKSKNLTFKPMIFLSKAIKKREYFNSALKIRTCQRMVIMALWWESALTSRRDGLFRSPQPGPGAEKSWAGQRSWHQAPASPSVPLSHSLPAGTTGWLGCSPQRPGREHRREVARRGNRRGKKKFKRNTDKQVREMDPVNLVHF